MTTLVRMGSGANVAGFVTSASDALSQVPDHDELRFLLVRRLAEAGLLRRAAAFADGFSTAVRSRADFASMRRQLGGRSSDGCLGWSHLRGQFEANMAVLRGRFACADEVASAWEAGRRHLELHRTTNGAYQVFDKRSEGGGWRPSFGDHTPRPSVGELASQFNYPTHPLVIEGVGLGLHLPWLFEATKNTLHGACSRIYQIEPSPLGVAVALHLNDWRAPLADARVRICCGAGAYDEFESLVRQDACNAPPQMVVHARTWVSYEGETAERRVARLSATVESERLCLWNAVSKQYDGRDRAWWCERYRSAVEGSGPALRVLGITCRFTTVLQYSMRDALKALEANGCETRLLIEADDHSRITPLKTLTTIHEFEPDLIVIIDHLRQGQCAGLVEAVPFVTWIQDRLPWLFKPEAGASIGPLDFCMGFSRAELVEQHGYPADRFLACDMATDAAAMCSDVSGSESDERLLSCDVAYATNYYRREVLYEDFRRQSDAALGRLLDAVYEELLVRLERSELNGSLNAEEFVKAMESEVGIELESAARAGVSMDLVRPLIDQLIRQQTIRWAARWAEENGRRFNLYGRGWEEHPEYAKYARGFIEHGPRLGRAFRLAKVHLHAGVNSAFHQRVLDGLAAGGFFLVRRHANDMWYRFRPAILEVVRQRALVAGDGVCLTDLPLEVRDEWIADRRMRGLAPDTPYELSEQYVEEAHGRRQAVAESHPLCVWPELDRVTFGTRKELADRLNSFVQDDAARSRVAATMRKRMLATFGYEALMRRLLSWMTDTLARP